MSSKFDVSFYFSRSNFDSESERKASKSSQTIEQRSVSCGRIVSHSGTKLSKDDERYVIDME